MQRCPYIYEMKERLLGEHAAVNEPTPKIVQAPQGLKMDAPHKQQQHQPVATVVRLNADGYSSHTSPTHQRPDIRTPLMTKEPEDDFHYVETSVYPKNAKTSLFIIMSFVYAKLLIVICIAYLISDVVTHNIPLLYYEGFFTYLYGASILFLLYVFCFLLQESTCCSGGEKKEPVKKVTKEKAKEKEQEKKKEEEKKKKEEKERQKKEKKEKESKEKDKDKKGKKQEKEPQQGVVQPPAPPPQPPQAPAPTAPLAPAITDVEAGLETVAVAGNKCKRKRKTTQNDQSHGSFFLRIGAIAFGLGTMIYNGLEFGAFFEIPITSNCYMILKGINPILQMIFTFMQMYFIFMNSRLNIHRFKVIARFGLMHVVATNICVWIRTLVLEYIKEITLYYQRLYNTTSSNLSFFEESIRLHTLRNAGTVLGTHVPKPDVAPTNWRRLLPNVTSTTQNYYWNAAVNTAATTRNYIPTTLATTTKRSFTSTLRTLPTTFYRLYQTTSAALTTASTTTPTTTTIPTTTTTTTIRPSTLGFRTTDAWKAVSTAATTTSFSNAFDYNRFNDLANVAEDSDTNFINGSENFEGILPQAFFGFNIPNITLNTTHCGRVNIMGSIVQDSAPYLFPFIIEYSLIGAAVIYVMWKHIGRNPRYVSAEDLEHRLEVMLSRRAVAMAHAQHQGRVDCVGASKGLFFGLLLLVGSLICLILFFVLIHHPSFGLLAIYLADVSHCVLMILSIIAIIIGFIRVQHLKFRVEEQSDLNDILLRVSAFGLFAYAVFSVIAGHLDALGNEPNLLVMVTGVLSVLQVILQLLFIADVSRRRVHLPEHDRSKPGRQVVTFLLICNVTMWIIYTFEMQKVEANPVQLKFYGFLAWSIVQRLTLPLCIFHRFHSAVTLAEIWKTSYKARLE